jgi:hypothetical protein
LFLGSLLAAGAAATGPAADRVFLHGGVYTVDAHRPWAEAVAIRDGAIVYVGDDAGARAHIGAGTQVTDLTGRMLLPGFHDGHAHVLPAGMSLNECDLEDRRELDWIRGRLDECMRKHGYGPDEWVVGAHWALAAFANGVPPKQWLDEAFAGRPAYFVDSFGHSAWVSSRALELAGIDAATPNPPNGIIERDPATGAANGTLRDGAMDLVSRLMPKPDAARLREGLAAGLARVNALGITAYVEPGMSAETIAAYVEADRAGRLSARVLASLSPIAWESSTFSAGLFELVAKREQFRGRYLSADSVKIYIDGVLETKTAFMLEPYLDGGNFPPFYTQDVLNDYYRRLDAMGVQVHTHAIGDAAIRAALDAYAHARQVNGPNDNRHQIVHLQIIDPADVPRFGELGVAADFQSLWAYPDDYITIAKPLVGEERVNRFYPIASVQKSGGRIVGGSDWDVSSLNPLDAIETAVRRRDPWKDAGPALNEAEAVDLATMIAAYTINAAWVMRLERLTGSIETGKRADLVVLDRNLFEVPATALNEARVLLTLMDGRTVYEAAAAQKPSAELTAD